MISESDFYKIERQTSQLYASLELEIIQEIAERIVNVGYANTVVYNNVAILEELGILQQDIVRLVAEFSNKSESEITRIFNEAGIMTLAKDDKIYKAMGKNPQGLSQSMKQIINATARNTNMNLERLTKTIALDTQVTFLQGVNEAYLEVSSGTKSYTEAVADVVKKVANKSTKIAYPSGVQRSIESATRTNIITSVNQMSGWLQRLRAEEMGQDLMELSAHGGARPEHAEWQGKIVSLSGQAGYLSLDDIGYGEVTGFQGANCRHTWFPYYKGMSLTYTSRELYDLRNETATYNGETMSLYDATQKQRNIERSIRYDKKELAGLTTISSAKDINDEELKSKRRKVRQRIKEKNNKLDDFCDQTGLKNDKSRLRI